MGAEALVVASLGMGVMQGVQSYQSGQQMGAMYDADARLLEAESFRDAAMIEEEGQRFKSKQKLAFIGSGVEIGGSAVVTLAQTDKWNKAEAESVRARGRATRSYYERMGSISRSQGRAGFISGIMGGVANAYSVYSATKAPGTLGTKSVGAADTAWNARTTGMKQMARF